MRAVSGHGEDGRSHVPGGLGSHAVGCTRVPWCHGVVSKPMTWVGRRPGMLALKGRLEPELLGRSLPRLAVGTPLDGRLLDIAGSCRPGGGEGIRGALLSSSAISSSTSWAPRGDPQAIGGALGGLPGRAGMKTASRTRGQGRRARLRCPPVRGETNGLSPLFAPIRNGRSLGRVGPQLASGCRRHRERTERREQGRTVVVVLW